MLSVVKYPGTVLKTVCREIDLDKHQDQTVYLAKQMEDVLLQKNAMGIAAPQVGNSVRLIVFDSSPEMKGNPNIYRMVNPEVVKQSEDTTIAEEGCLSFPGVRVPIKRSTSIVVKWQDPHTKEILQGEFKYYVARCILHEIDHLNGVLMPDKIGAMKSMFLQKYFKANRK
jgi:peptide deformylase